MSDPAARVMYAPGAHPPSDRLLIIQQLLARQDSDSREIARLMSHLPA